MAHAFVNPKCYIKISIWASQQWQSNILLVVAKCFDPNSGAITHLQLAVGSKAVREKSCTAFAFGGEQFEHAQF
jgi:hypothetical protein